MPLQIARKCGGFATDKLAKLRRKSPRRTLREMQARTYTYRTIHAPLRTRSPGANSIEESGTKSIGRL